MRMRWRGPVCGLLAVMLLAAAACGRNEDPREEELTTLPVMSTVASPSQPKDTLTLPFAQRDVLNPYAVETELNRELLPLLYEGLFTIDETFKAQPVLAEGIAKQSDTQWVVSLRGGRVFHDGKKVTAEDALYSFQKARASAHYAARLANITRVQKQEDGKLLFTLKKANEYIAACLDFPIVPNGSANQGKLSQAKSGYSFTKDSTPSGTGRYRLQSKDSVFYLSYNVNYPGEGQTPSITTIQFFGLNSTGSLLYGLEMGNYQFAYDTLNSGEIKRVNAASQRIPTTNLVYLSFNQSRGTLQDAKLRVALAACIDKAKVLSDAYQAYAEPVSTPFPPRWHGVKAEDFTKPYDASGARKSLEALGYSETRDGVRASRYRKLNFTLLVNQGSKAKVAAAKSIQSQLKAFQIGVTLQALPKADYTAAVKAGRFDLCLGEIKLTPDCNLSPLLLTGGVATKGIHVWGKTSNAYGQLLQGLQKPAEFASAFMEEMPYIPLGYRNGMAVSIRSLYTSAQMRQNNLFCDIASWHF